MTRTATVGSRNGSQEREPDFEFRPSIPSHLRAARRIISDAAPHYTYVMYGKRGEVLYVGMARDPLVRFRGHAAHGSPWMDEVERVECWRHPNKRQALNHERELILDLKPPFNVMQPVVRIWERRRHG